MTGIVVVGSGASGVHFALSLLRRGHEVTMLDLGYPGPRAPLPEARVSALKEELDDPVEYFLGENYQAVILPDSDREYYGLPPSKDFVLRSPPGFGALARGFAPLFSFAAGGLAEAWTAGCYPFDDGDLESFPFSYQELQPCYEEVTRRIGVTGSVDDLSRFLPVHGELLPPLDLDQHSKLLLDRYRQRRAALRSKLGFHLGRTRVATLTRDLGHRSACTYLGRCLWGCPTESLYTPALTLRECRSYPGFRYRPGVRVLYFETGAGGRVTRVVARSEESGEELRFPVETLALAAGTLSSAAIVLRSVAEATGERPELGGLMDNLQVLVPFVNLGMVGKGYSERSYQYHLLGIGLEGERPADYVHGQVTTLKTGMLHPIVQNLPFDLKTSTRVTRNLRAALGVVNLCFHDSRRPDNRVTLEPGDDGREPRLAIRYASPPRPAARVRAVVRRTRRALRRLGCVVPPGMAHVRPIGASVHYAGTFPMSAEAAPWTTDENCRSRDFPNLYLVDGSTFPELPAKNITFTLMANAVRVAERAF